MYTKRIFPIRGVIKWTSRHILLFLFLGAIPVIFYDLVGLKWLQVPWLPLGVLGTAVAFVIGFKNNASYDRLWEARTIWGGIVNTSRSWTVMVKDFITNDYAIAKRSDEELQDIKRELVYRHVAWLTALRFQMRQEKPWEMHIKARRANQEFKERQYIVLEDERQVEDEIRPYISESDFNTIFNKGNQASQLLGIQSSRLKDLKQAGLIEGFRHMALANIITELYALQGKSERIKNFPYPRQFATLNYIFVWIFILLVPYGIMAEFEAFGQKTLELLNEHEVQTSVRHIIQSTIAKHFVWFFVPFSALIAWVFHTMEAIGENTENPFEGGPNDVPITDMSRSIEIDIRQLIDDENILETYKWTNDIIM